MGVTLNTTPCGTLPDMGRRRTVQHGHVFVSGPSWFVKFWEYDADGNRHQRKQYVAPARGPDRVTRKDAETAAERLLEPINRRNQRPSSGMTVADFVTGLFLPHVAERKKWAGRKHYDYVLRTFVLPAFGHKPLYAVGVADVEEMVSWAQRNGYAHQTVKHAKYAASAVFRHARRLKLYADENPAHDIDIGDDPPPKRRFTFTWEQAADVLAHLKSYNKRYPVALMAELAISTSMNIAEILGVRRRWCNFTAAPAVVDGEVLAPYSIGVRENYYRGHWGTLKRGKRYRNVPITPQLAGALLHLIGDVNCATDPGQLPLFASRNGTPVDALNIAADVFRPLAKQLGYPIGWHAFRRCHSSFAAQLADVPLADRVATMGHADARMTLYYDIADMERRRAIPAAIEKRLGAATPAEGSVQ